MAKLLLAKKYPKLGKQIPNAGDDDQSCHILTVLFDRIDRLRVPQFNLFSSNLFYIQMYRFIHSCGGVYREIPILTVFLYPQLLVVESLYGRKQYTRIYIILKSVINFKYLKNVHKRVSLCPHVDPLGTYF